MSSVIWGLRYAGHGCRLSGPGAKQSGSQCGNWPEAEWRLSGEKWHRPDTGTQAVRGSPNESGISHRNSTPAKSLIPLLQFRSAKFLTSAKTNRRLAFRRPMRNGRTTLPRTFRKLSRLR